MRSILLSSLLLISISCTQKHDSSPTPSTTTIDLDEADKTVEKINVPVKVIYNNEWFESDPKLISSFIPFTRNIMEGPDSTLWVSDFANNRIVKLSADGAFIRSIGGPGSGPGEFMTLFGTMRRSDKYIYIPDTQGLRLQLFDFNFKYIRTIKNTLVESGNFFVTPSDHYFSTQPMLDIPHVPYMISMYDSLGNMVKRIGEINSRANFIIENNWRKFYYIVVNEKSNEIWCIFKFLPYIWKYDHKGRLIEEIKFTSKSLDEHYRKRDEIVKRGGTPGMDGGYVLLDYPQLYEEKLFLNVPTHGMVQISYIGLHSKINKLYNVIGLNDDILKRANSSRYLLRKINGKMYGFVEKGIIIREL